MKAGALQSPLERINLCFLLSGFCSLLYQTAWLRLAIAKFGVNAPVIASVLSVFMLGLALGNFLGGKYLAYLERNESLRGLRAYALLELIISIGGLTVPGLMSYGATAILSVPMTNGAYFVFSFLIILVALVPFCTAMGATFPIALSSFTNLEHSQKVRGFSQLYFANVCGAVYGTVFPAFVAFEWLGFQKTGYLAVAVNWLIFMLAWNVIPAIGMSRDAATESESTRSFVTQRRWALTALFVLGMCSLGLEVLWARIFVFFAGAVVYSFALILAIYLLFTALGTNFYRRFLVGRDSDIGKFWLSLAPAALLVLVSTHPGFDVAPIVRIFVGVAPVSFLLGVLTPSLVDECTRSEPYRVSIAYTFNLAGCIAGPLLTGFVAIPLLGNRLATYLVGFVFFVVSFYQVFRQQDVAASRRSSKGLLLVVVAVLGVLMLLDTPVESQFENAQVLYDHTATVIASGSGMDKRLQVDGTHVTSLNVMTKMFAHLPLAFLNHAPERSAVICFGMGTTFRSMTTWNIKTTVVELVPSVPKLFPFFFSDAARILENPNATVVIDDGRRFLSRGSETFDVIVIDPSPPVESVSSGLLYSTEFYDIVKKRLKKDGILGTIILSSDSQNLYSMVAALKESFPYVRLFEPYGEQNVFQVIASESPIPDRSAAQLMERMPPGSQKDLTEWIDSTPQWFPTTVEGMFEWLLGKEIQPSDLLARQQPWRKVPLTDDMPVNEYFFLRRTFRK